MQTYSTYSSVFGLFRYFQHVLINPGAYHRRANEHIVCQVRLRLFELMLVNAERADLRIERRAGKPSRAAARTIHLYEAARRSLRRDPRCSACGNQLLARSGFSGGKTVQIMVLSRDDQLF